MARFILTPCHLREDRVVPSKAEALELDWAGLVRALAPSRTMQAQTTLTRLRVSSFVGLMHSPVGGAPTNFALANTDASGSIGWLLKRHPDFPQRLHSIYRVEEATFDARIEEVDTGSPN